MKMSGTIEGVHNTAKEIIKNPGPMKCYEAVCLSIYLTSSIDTILRFTIRFVSTSGDGVKYKHVVLGIYHNGLFGALG